ncbi:MAG: 1-acyl-sn-glycerol-3-phosphate acyltransferase [Acidobacteriota bacterium]|nr:1-acyl-sn-glycerol-3-phosphate acyltransferase [Acidobacteriota bacterium]
MSGSPASSRRVLVADAGEPLAAHLVEILAGTLAPDPAARAGAGLGAGSWEVQHRIVTGRPGDVAPQTGALILVAERATPKGASAESTATELTKGDLALLGLAAAWLRGSIRATPPEERPRRLILVSSAWVHEPSHRHLGYLSEDQLPKRPPENRVARRWRALEAAFRERLEAVPGGRAALVSVILRPTPIPMPDGRDPLSGLLRGRASWAPAGYNPPLQLLTVHELATAARAALDDAVTGNEAGEPQVWQVAPEEAIPLRWAMKAAGVRRLPAPAWTLRIARSLAGSEPDGVDALCHAATVSDARWRRILAGLGRPLPPSTLQRPARELAHDPFGFDQAYVDRFRRTLFPFLHDLWWRVEWRGLEHVPRHGGGVLVGTHRGHQPWDGVMVLHRLAGELGRYPRFLIHPALIKFPFLARYMAGLGGINACRENGDWVLRQQELLGIFPEGIRGAFARYRNAYSLRRFRPDYVRFALQHQVPIVPFVVLGSAEIFPVLAKLQWQWWKRLSDWPCLPVTPTLSTLPLPSKWHVEFLEPLDPAREYGPEAAQDGDLVRRLNREVHQRMDEALQALLTRRRHIFWGSLFNDAGA